MKQSNFYNHKNDCLNNLFRISVIFLTQSFYLIPNLKSQTDSLLTHLPLTDQQLDSNQLYLKQHFQSQLFTESFKIVEIGDLPLIQENGILPLRIPGDTLTYYFNAAEVVSLENGDYTWIGELVSPMPCVDDSSDYLENDCLAGGIILIKSGASIFGEIFIENDYYQIKDIGGGLNMLIKLNIEEFEDHACTTPYSETEPEELEPEEEVHCPVRALVLYTTAAKAAHPDILNVINLSIANTNFILKSSNISNSFLKIVLAGTKQLDTTEFVETFDLMADLNSLPNNNAIKTYRVDYSADIVIIMTTAVYPGGGGVTAFGDNYTSADSAYAIVETPFSTKPVHTFAHEVGHLFGTRHERMPDDCASMGDNTGLQYSHGKIITKKFLGNVTLQKKTVMGICAGDNSIPRIEYYSNPNIKYKNKAIGTEQNNYNAKTIAFAACRVSHYINSDEPTVYLTGPDTLCPEQYASLEGIVLGVPAPIVYYWQTSPDGLNYTPNPPAASSSNGIGVTLPSVMGQSIWIKLTAGSSGGPLATAIKRIVAGEPHGQSCDPFFVSSSDNKNNAGGTEVDIFPNPVSEKLFVRINNLENKYCDFNIYDSFGRLVKEGALPDFNKNKNLFFFDLLNFKSGLYFLHIRNPNSVKVLPFFYVN